MCKGYGDLKEELLRRGWVKNPDYVSEMYSLKWTLLERDINYESLRREQIVNHFQKSSHITTKAGLNKTLKSCRWSSDVDPNSFYPVAFDLSQEEELDDYVQDFKFYQLHSLILTFLQNYQQ